MSKPEQAYVSTRPCGCAGVVAMEWAHETPKMVQAAIRRGETVARMTVEAARALELRCPEHRRVTIPTERQGAML